MKPAHSLVWETTGIHDAIMDSGLKIPKNERLFLWFVEKWSPKTNTFVTLEDIMVLGGFSVLGAPVSLSLESPEDHAALAEPVQAYKVLVRSHLKKASLSAWMNIFKGTQIHMVILLAKRRRIALAPAVLAALYQDLHFLQDAIIDVLQDIRNDVVKGVFSPMYYFQAWIWERFSNVSPIGETRLARWCRLDVAANVGDLEDGTCKEYFVWRPYANNTNHFISKRVYVSYGSWKEIENEEVESYARCLTACKLVDLDIGQDYSSHRVCRQFGYTQDIPADILQIEDNENAWAGYFTPLTGSDVYIPSRKYEGQAPARYEDPWEKEPDSPSNPQVPLLPKRWRKRISAN